VSSVIDNGFYVQLSDMVIPKKIELYAGTSWVFSNYGRPKEFLGGVNYYPWNTRNARVNMQLIDVNHSPVNSTFGFYVGQLHGTIFSFGMTAMY
jgi:hypothetical protein